MKKIIFMMIYDVIGSVFIGVSIVCFAVAADFAPGGVNGIAVMANYLANIPIGLATILINIPIILFTFRSLGKAFFLYSVKTMVISSFLIDYVLCYLPAYNGNRLLAAILAGITAGIGYSLIFNEGSSTGGTDFIIAAIKKKRPKMTFGLLAFAVDGIIVLFSIFVFKEALAFIYGMVYTIVTSVALDLCTLVLKKMSFDIYRLGGKYKMKNPKMIIFDVDGLLLNTEFLWRKAWKDVAAKYGVPKFGEVFGKVVGISGSDVERVLNNELSDVENRMELLDIARSVGTEYLENDIELMPGVNELLDVLENKNIRKAVATTTSRDATIKRLTKLGLINRFEYILCGDEVTKRKPNPEIYQKVLKAINCDPNQVMVLEDTGYGVQAAHDAGIQVVMVPSINAPTDTDIENASYIKKSLYEVISMLEA